MLFIHVCLRKGPTSLIITGDHRCCGEDFHQIVEILKGCASRWREIGIALGFKPLELTMIQSNPMLLLQDPPHSYMRHMLSHWLQWAPGDGRGSKSYPTRGMLSAALWKANLGALASDLPQGLLVTCNSYQLFN